MAVALGEVGFGGIQYVFEAPVEVLVCADVLF